MDQGPEVVVREDHLGRLFGDFRPAPHCNPDVGLLEGGGIVHGVACHGDDQSLPLHYLDETQFVLRRHPPENVKLIEVFDHFVVAQSTEVSSTDCSRP